MATQVNLAKSQNVVSARGQRFLEFVKRLYRQPASAFGTTVFLLFALMAIVGPLVAPYGANEQIYEDARKPPSPEHWFGTDHLGRDVFSRVIFGARDIFMLAGLGTLLAVLIGTSFGLVSGYYRGWFDEILMRFFDGLMSIPALLFALLMLGTIGPIPRGRSGSINHRLPAYCGPGGTQRSFERKEQKLYRLCP